MKDLEARIRKVEDRHEIENLQAQYSFLIDSSRIDEALDLFTSEFVWEVGFDQMTTITSREKLKKLLKKGEEANVMECHQPVTPYIEINGDEASGIWYLFGMITARSDHGEIAKWVQGKYTNIYQRVSTQWKISRLSFRYNFLTPYEDGWVKTPNDPYLKT